MKLILTILSITLWNILYSQIDWTVEEEFRGPVKSVSTYSYSNNSPIISISTNDTATNYNSIEIGVIILNKEKKPIKSVKLNGVKDTAAYCIWTYDKLGREITKTDYSNNNRLDQKIEYSYGKNGKSFEKYYDGKGVLFSTWITEIDSEHFLFKRYELINGKIDDNYLTTLNNSFLPLCEFKVDSKGDKTKYSELVYDNNNRIVSSVWNGDSLNYNHYEYRYNKKGDLIETKKFNKTGQVIELTNQHYDEFGNVIQILIFHPTDASTTTTSIKRIDYSYDKQGNWLSKTEYFESKDGSSHQISKVIRTIEYY